MTRSRNGWKPARTTLSSTARCASCRSSAQSRRAQAHPARPVLTFVPTKGDDSAFREGRPDPAVIPLVPELQALIDEVPADRFTFIHSEFDRPFKSAASLGNRVGKWRRDAGLPEGLSAHGMRKVATYWAEGATWGPIIRSTGFKPLEQAAAT